MARRSSPYRSRAAGVVTLFDLNFTAVVTGGSKGIAPAAKTLDLSQGNVSATLVNAASAFLAADPNGLVLTNGTGLTFDTTGASASTDDWNPGNLGAVLSVAFSDVVPAALWAATVPLLCSMYSRIETVIVFDASACNANTELANMGVSESTSHNAGASGRVGFAGGAVAAGAAVQTASFDAIGGTLVSWGLTAGVLPTAARLVTTRSGSQLSYGYASGLVPPSVWYSKDAAGTMQTLKLVAAAGGCLRGTMQLNLGVADISATGTTVTFKRAIARGYAHSSPVTVT